MGPAERNHWAFASPIVYHYCSSRMMAVGHEHAVLGGAHHSLRDLAGKEALRVRQAQILCYWQLPNSFIPVDQNEIQQDTAKLNLTIDHVVIVPTHRAQS